jgi:PIN domain nuclease of toxin-antitoxin system
LRLVLDAWAVTALLEDEEAAAAVEELMSLPDVGMSSINLGEVYYIAVRRDGRRRAGKAVDAIRATIHVEDPDWRTVRAAAVIKAGGGLSYPDAFCVATAMRHRAPLYTGDPEIIGLDADVEVIDLRSST